MNQSVTVSQEASAGTSVPKCSSEAHALFTRNLEALRIRQPDVATKVERASIPAAAQRVTARDGGRTFQLLNVEGRRVWLGGSSMPRVSSEALLGTYVSDGSSLVLPGMATGQEAIVLASRLPACAAIVVIEQDPCLVRMAFELYDYTELLGSGRLVIVTGGQADDDITTFFFKNLGYHWPTHMLALAQYDHAWSAEVQTHLDRAAQAVARRQEEAVHRLAKSVGKHPMQLSAGVRRVALLSTNASPSSLAHARLVQQSLKSMEWPVTLSVPATPDACHLVARLGAIEAVRADLVLLIDCHPGQLVSQLPKSLPIVSWFWPGSHGGVLANDPPPSNKTQLLLASSKTQHEYLKSLGYDAKQLGILPPGAEVLGSSDSDDCLVRSPVGGEPAITVLSDLPDDRPEVSHVTQVSQVRLWDALRNVVAANLDHYHENSLDRFFREAQRRCGTTLSDEMSRAHFRKCLKTRIGPAARARATATFLESNGVRVTVSGSHWNLHETDRALCEAVNSQQHNSSDAACNAGIIVIPVLSDIIVPRLLNALASGVAVVVGARREDFNTEYPGLDGIATYLYWYHTTRELLKTIHKLSDDPPDDARTRREQMAFVRAHHSIEQRLRAIDCMSRKRHL